MQLAFWNTAEAWAGSAHPNSTRSRHRIALQQLRGLNAIPPNAKIRYLHDVDWHALRECFLVLYSASSWNHLRKGISKFLSDPFDDVDAKFRRDLFKRNPKTKRVRFPTANERPRISELTPKTFMALVGYLPDYVRPPIMTLAITGLRIGEYLRLTPAHLKSHTCSIDVPGTKTDASAATIPIDVRLWPWVERAVPPPLAYKWLRIHFKRAVAQAGVPDARLHDLRHCTAAWLIDAGRPEVSVQQTMRHASPDMTRHYARMKSKGEDAKTMADIILDAQSA